MSVILITGIPGSGKTLFAVSQLKKAYDKNKALPVDEQRKIYCDITGLTLEGVEPPPMDWRKTPPKSLLIYDEAQFHNEFKPTRGLTQFKQVEDLTIHRKTGHEIWFITQDPRRLHKDILGMVEQHYHLERPYGAKLATIYQYRGHEPYCNRPTVKERAERKRVFRYDKSLFDLYQSSQVDDGIKLRLPNKIIAYCLFIVACLGLFGYLVTGDDTQKYIASAKGESVDFDKDKEKPLVDGSTITNGVNAPTQQPVKTLNTDLSQVAFATVLNNKCVMFTSKAEIVQGDDKECLNRLTPPKHIDYKLAYRSAVLAQDKAIKAIKAKTVNPNEFYYQSVNYAELN